MVKMLREADRVMLGDGTLIDGSTFAKALLKGAMRKISRMRSARFEDECAVLQRS